MTTLHDAARQALEEHANRYQVVRDGYWWRVKIGNGTQTVGQYHTETGALRLAADLHRAFHDGGFVVQEALRKALAQQAEPAPGWCKHCKQYSIEEPLPAQQEPDLRGANPIGLTPPQKDLQRAQFRADALAQQAEPVMWQFKHYTETEWRELVPRTGQSIEQALAEIRGYCGPKGKPYYEVRCLYTAPPQRKPLTEEEIYEMYSEPSSDAEMVDFARAIERAHGIGGNNEQA